ncbi:MAG: TolC family protein [Balneolales bacterium]
MKNLTFRLSILIIAATFFNMVADANARDTVRVNFDQFIALAQDRSPTLSTQSQIVDLAENRIQQAKNNRFLPNLNLTTAHGIVPGLKSFDENITPGSFYLDPNLENDWENWAVFTQAEVSSLQPIYTWGGITSLIHAARKSAEAARFEFDSEKESFNLKLFELYQSALLAMEMNRLMEDAISQLERAESELEKLREQGNASLEEKDIFEFYIFQAEFQALRTEMQQNHDFIFRTWNLVLAGDDRTVYLPEERFMDPIPIEIQNIDYYRRNALQNRAELKGITAAGQAAQHGVDAARSRYYPSLILGLSAGFGYTPNRPRQQNPFIRNNSNFMSARIGFGLQQSLNFWQTRTQVQRSQIQQHLARDFHDAATEGILLEIHDNYRETMIAHSRIESKRNALTLSSEWLRTEQIDLDLGFGDIKNLVDAVKKKMELEVDVKQMTFELNMKIANLHHAAGLPLSNLIPDPSSP